MIESMTGYGKGEALCNGTLFRVELKAVNGKSFDLSMRGQSLPREKEIATRELIAKELQRGSVEFYLTVERSSSEEGRRINRAVFNSYLEQLQKITAEDGKLHSATELLPLILPLPSTIESENEREALSEVILTHWGEIEKAIKEALEMLKEFRRTEGQMLQKELLKRVNSIVEFSNGVEKYEEERAATVRNRLLDRVAELKESIEEGRFEQELLYYLEKLDITEEKVRLRQHCNYFVETVERESSPGKKLGFISQEMGREINTLGAKANHFELQKIAVAMKEELEKIKEQLFNVL